MKVLLWILLVGATVAALLSLLGLDVLEAVGSPARVGELVSIVLGLGGIFVFLISSRSWFARRVVAAQFRMPWRDTPPLRRQLLRKLRAALIESESLGDSPVPLASARRLIELDGIDSKVVGISYRWPWAWRGTRQWITSATERARNAPATRVFAPELARRVAERADRFEAALDAFVNFEPVTWGELARYHTEGSPPEGERFSEAVSRLTGAFVLIDAADSRTYRAESAVMWHSNRYRPEGPDGKPGLYADVHGGDAPDSCLHNVEMRAERRSRPSDFDGRVVDVRGAALVRDARRGGVHLLLDTAESCYAATEIGAARCKHLEPADVRGPVWRPHASDVLWERDPTDNGRTSLLTVSAAVSITASDGGRSILVMKRARGLRNGSDVVALPGGVMTLGFAGMPGDEDNIGLPSLEEAVAREVREEIGLDIPTGRWDAVAICLINDRGAGSTKGELVMTALLAASVADDLAQVQLLRDTESSQAGRYESEWLAEIPLAPILDEPEPRLRAAQRFAASVADIARDIDQRTVVACMYAAAEHYGRAETLRAFDAIEEGRRWPARPWAEEAPDSPGRQLLPLDDLVLGN